MRRKIVAGNWKMNTTPTEGIRLAKEVESLLRKNNQSQADVILGVPFTHLIAVKSIIETNNIALAAQDCSPHESGAYTGEISAEMIKDTGATYCIIGHSERRKYHHENDSLLLEKVKMALLNELRPIFCCGEIIEERNEGRHFTTIKEQLVRGLLQIDVADFSKLIIAYEPVWAIGTGLTATPEQAQEMHSFIRDIVKEHYGTNVSESVPILYGGSCKPDNANELFTQNDVDGGLIGGASLKADDFIKIMNAF